MRPRPARRVPDDVRTALGGLLADGESVEAVGCGPAGYAAATGLGLWVQDPTTGGFRRLDWHRIDHVSWRDGQLRLQPSPSPGDAAGPPVVLPLAEPGRLPGTVRRHLERSIAFAERAPAGVRVVGRRRPADGAYEWSLRYDPGVDPADPDVRQQASRLLDRARASHP